MFFLFLFVCLFPFRFVNAGEGGDDPFFEPLVDQARCGLVEDSSPNFTFPGTTARQCNAPNHQHVDVPISPPSLGRVWTHEPQCLSDLETSEKFCTYTNSTFASNRGISLFTSPTLATFIAALPAFTAPTLAPSINNFTNAPWEIRHTPGRGNGLFATRLLHRGDPILASTPVGIFQSDAFVPDYGLGYRYLGLAYEQLPAETRALVMRMARRDGGQGEGHGQELMERINTNAFAGEFAGKPCFWLYPETALMNHDCRPNAMYHHDPSTLIHATYASRTILPGEEITITYINILQPRSLRQEALVGAWGFQCTCSLCSSPPSAIALSDTHIAHIHDLQTQLSDWSASSQATPLMAEELLALYERENIHAALGMGHMFAALAYNAVGDVSRAKWHARLALQAGMVSNGSGGEDEDEMRSLREDPMRHWSWMVRAKRRR